MSAVLAYSAIAKRVHVSTTMAFTALLALLCAPGLSLAEERSVAGKTKLNRLATEASPYLRLHAANPVDWYPWGPQAFAKARRENKPIFLSVGYSTCHWCHVMARESFENETIAALLSKHVISVKVDRERHPDVDQVYMLATELINKRGGWPNSVFLTPDLKPFFAATYLPPDVFADTISRVAEAWRTIRPRLEADAQSVSDAITSLTTARVAARERPPEALKAATGEILAQLDEFHGGLGAAPKFPREPVLLHFLHRAERHADAAALAAARLTLDGMLNGGIHDQLAGGFHRYAVDEAWRIPHFEKMLYNQALIATALVRAWRVTGAPHYAKALRRTLDFVMSDMTAPEGGFYSALDAETDGREGVYYLWTPEEIRNALGERAPFAIAAFGVTDAGNLEGANVLHRPRSGSEQAAAEGVTTDVLETRLDAARSALLAARDKRARPRRDEKILAAWNGLMIRAFAEAGTALGEPRYLAAASKAASFIATYMGAESGRIQRVYFEGKAAIPGTQSDYVYLGLAQLALFDATADTKWLDAAVKTTEAMLADFLDAGAGDFFSSVATDVFVRAKSRDDAELPSGNAAALELLSRLSRRHAAPEWRHRADALAAAITGFALGAPVSNAHALTALDLHDHGETGALQFAGKGAVRASLSASPTQLSIKLTIAPGWHINADKPLEEFLIPTVVKVPGNAAASIRYPAAVKRKLGFNEAPMALYEGDVEIAIEQPAGTHATQSADRVTVQLQTCSDKICLDPETLVLSRPHR